jgi:3-dehydroquinate synthase
VNLVIIPVEVPSAEYEVLLGSRLMRELGARIKTSLKAKKVALITDEIVGDTHGIEVQAELLRAGFEVEGFTVAPGEQAKTWPVAGELLEALASAGLDRRDAVVTLGGGVVSDLGGFVASAYLRGIDFVNIPTTLLAQVDASVGGKTGVDLRAGKNLAGAFKQPRVVIVDTAFLETLPDAEWSSGFAEIAKAGAIDSFEFLEWLEANATALAAHEEGVVFEAVRRSVVFKAGVVAGDEREAGRRECLNYGHTLGHAIEKVLGYGEISHGQAVAEGMRFSALLASKMLDADATYAPRLGALLDAMGLPHQQLELNAEALISAMHSDKKARAGEVRFVVVRRPGAWSVTPVSDVILRDALAEFLGG